MLTSKQLIPLVCWVALAVPQTGWGQGRSERFLPIKETLGTRTYDLESVQLIQPGKFTILSITTDDPDTLRLRLNVVEALRQHCSRAAGRYAPSKSLFTLGQPDMPVVDIEVQNTKALFKGDKPKKIVTWHYPYEKLAFRAENETVQRAEFFSCDESYHERRAEITNGVQAKELFDCERGFIGSFMSKNDPLTKTIPSSIRPDTHGSMIYEAVCFLVTNKEAYQPK